MMLYLSRTSSIAMTSVLLSLVLLGSGCSTRPVPSSATIEPPTEFTDGAGQWAQVPGEVSAEDNQRIGQFFHRNSQLLDSPEWTGTPVKYRLANGKSKLRYYWFSGEPDSPIWHALEFNGNRMQDLTGQGYPGSKSIGASQQH